MVINDWLKQWMTVSHAPTSWLFRKIHDRIHTHVHNQAPPPARRLTSCSCLATASAPPTSTANGRPPTAPSAPLSAAVARPRLLSPAPSPELLTPEDLRSTLSSPTCGVSSGASTAAPAPTAPDAALGASAPPSGPCSSAGVAMPGVRAAAGVVCGSGAVATHCRREGVSGTSDVPAVLSATLSGMLPAWGDESAYHRYMHIKTIIEQPSAEPRIVAHRPP